jgi:hypothetical protein
MVAGAVVFFGTGRDIWVALADDTVGGYLAAVAGNEAAHYLNLSLWCAGVLLIALGGSALARRGGGAAADMARTSYAVAAAMAITSFLLMAAVVRIADHGAEAVAAAAGLGFAGARLDDVATAVVIGLGPLLLALSGAVSGWLARWGWVCGAAACVAVVSIFFGASGEWGMVVVPVGIGWTLVTGLVLLRRGA